MTPEEIAAATALCEKAPFAIEEFRRLVMEKLGVSGCLEATQLAELSTESAKALASLTEAYAEIAQVKDIHALIVEGTMEWCAACTTSWPCATLQVLWNHSLRTRNE